MDASIIHPSLAGLFLPPPDPSSAVVNLFGTARTDAQDQLEQLYASQIAAILFVTKGASEDHDEQFLSTASKPVCVGLGLKPAFVETQNMEDQRRRFAEVMQLLSSIV